MNSALYGKQYEIPKEIVDSVNKQLLHNPRGKNAKRAKFIVNNKKCTYQMLKRLKNYFDHLTSEEPKNEYELAGGQLMKNFVESTLTSERGKSKSEKKIMQPIVVGVNDPTLKAQTGEVNLTTEEEEKEIEKDGDSKPDISKLSLNTVAIIFDRTMKILMLQRSDYPDQWMPSKWALPGGMMEANEKPEATIRREIKEETKLDVDHFIERFVIQRDDNVEHIFVAKVYDRPEIKLNKEHQKSGWFTTEEISKLDNVPNVLDYIRIAVEINY